MKGRMMSVFTNTYEAVSAIAPLNLDGAVEFILNSDRISFYGYDDEAVAEIGQLDFYERKALAIEAIKSYF